MRPVPAPLRAVVPLAAILVIVLVALPGNAFPQRRTHDREFPALGDGEFVLADLTGDDRADLAAVDDQLGKVWFYEGGPAGLPPTPTGVVYAPNVLDLAVGDVNGDGRMDLLAVDGTSALRLDPEFGPSVLALAPGSQRLAAGDLDGDGLLDLAVLGTSGATAWFQLTRDRFDENATLSLAEGVAFDDLVAADLNGDGRDDLALARPYEVRVYLQGDLGLDPLPVPIGTKGTGGGVSAGVAASAGDVPYLVVASGTGWEDAYVGLWRWTHDGFAREASFTGPYTDRFAIGDTNDDGWPDFAVVATDATIDVFLQRGATFSASSPDLALAGATPQTETRVGIGDVNGDGFEDVLARASGTFYAYLQEDAMPRFIRAIPSTYVVNRGAIAPDLIDLRQFFADDHNALVFSVVLASDPEHLAATIEGSALAFEAADWFGTAEFRVSAWDGNPSHPPVESNLFTVLVNDVPAITSVPLLRATAGREYAYVVTVADAYPAGDVHAFALLEGPVGMAVDAATGLVTWTPTDAQVGSHDVALQAADGNGGAGIQRFVVVVVAPAAGGSPAPLVALGVALSSAALLAAAAALNENAKYAFLLFFLPMYTKIKRERVLDHFVRGQIFGYIQANPGEHYNGIKDALGLTNGSLAHHLRTLEREQFVKSRRYGLYRRFYPMSYRMPAEDAYQPNEIQVTILRTIRERPGITQKEIAERLGLSPPTVNYHVSVLADRKLIRVDHQGRSTHCSIVEGSSW